MKKSKFLQGPKDMLHRSFKPDKCKTSLRMGVSRLKLMRNKKEVQVKQLRKEIAQLLESGNDQSARIKVEHVVREEKMMSAYEWISIYSELVMTRMPIIESQKNCPIDLKEAITSLIFASPRCGDIPELLDVQKQFTAKYGKEFVSAAIELRPDCGVSRMLVEKLSAKAPDGQTKLKILKAIAEEYSIKWDPKSFGENDVTAPTDLLKGPASFQAATEHIQSPQNQTPQTSQAPVVHAQSFSHEPSQVSHDQIHHQPLKHEQNGRFSQNTQNVNSTNSESRQTPSYSQHEAKHSGVASESPTGGQSYSGDRNTSLSHGRNRVTEFKDAASAAEAAADSAEMASMAARAAAELANRDSMKRRHHIESQQSGPHSRRDSSEFAGEEFQKQSSNSYSSDSRRRSDSDQLHGVKFRNQGGSPERSNQGDYDLDNYSRRNNLRSDNSVISGSYSHSSHDAGKYSHSHRRSDSDQLQGERSDQGGYDRRENYNRRNNLRSNDSVVDGSYGRSSLGKYSQKGMYKEEASKRDYNTKPQYNESEYTSDAQGSSDSEDFRHLQAVDSRKSKHKVGTAKPDKFSKPQFKEPEYFNVVQEISNSQKFRKIQAKNSENSDASDSEHRRFKSHTVADSHYGIKQGRTHTDTSRRSHTDTSRKSSRDSSSAVFNESGSDASDSEHRSFKSHTVSDPHYNIKQGRTHTDTSRRSHADTSRRSHTDTSRKSSRDSSSAVFNESGSDASDSEHRSFKSHTVSDPHYNIKQGRTHTDTSRRSHADTSRRSHTDTSRKSSGDSDFAVFNEAGSDASDSEHKSFKSHTVADSHYGIKQGRTHTDTSRRSHTDTSRRSHTDTSRTSSRDSAFAVFDEAGSDHEDISSDTGPKYDDQDSDSESTPAAPSNILRIPSEKDIGFSGNKLQEKPVFQQSSSSGKHSSHEFPVISETLVEDFKFDDHFPTKLDSDGPSSEAEDSMDESSHTSRKYLGTKPGRKGPIIPSQRSSLKEEGNQGVVEKSHLKSTLDDFDDEISTETSSELSSKLNYGKLTGGLRHKRYDLPPYRKTQVDDATSPLKNPVESSSSEVLEYTASVTTQSQINTKVKQNTNSRKSLNLSHDNSDNDSSEDERPAYGSGFGENTETNSRSKVLVPYFESDSEEVPLPSKQNSSGRKLMASGLSRRTKATTPASPARTPKVLPKHGEPKSSDFSSGRKSAFSTYDFRSNDETESQQAEGTKNSGTLKFQSKLEESHDSDFSSDGSELNEEPESVRTTTALSPGTSKVQPKLKETNDLESSSGRKSTFSSYGSHFTEETESSRRNSSQSRNSEQSNSTRKTSEQIPESKLSSSQESMKSDAAEQSDIFKPKENAPGTTKTSQASQLMDNAPSRLDSGKKPSHVHPKLPDYDSFAAFFKNKPSSHKPYAYGATLANDEPGNQSFLDVSKKGESFYHLNEPMDSEESSQMSPEILASHGTPLLKPPYGRESLLRPPSGNSVPPPPPPPPPPPVAPHPPPPLPPPKPAKTNYSPGKEDLLSSPPPPPPPVKTNAPPAPPPPVKKNTPPAPPPPRGGPPPRPPPMGLNPPRASSSGQVPSTEEDGADNPRTKLKPFFWDKVNADADDGMVWHQINAGSFRFNEETIESLFGYAAAEKNQNEMKKHSSNKDQEDKFIQIISQKKAHNFAILLKGLNVKIEEVCDALEEGNELPADLIETVLKMAPTAEEEVKLRQYSGEISRLGNAERFLKVLVDIPFAFKRLESLLFMYTFEEDKSMVKESFATLEAACTELRKSRLFLKLLEAVLKTGNRMNDGTFRGRAQAFKLDTLLKLSDVKGTDGKTTLLHFVVKEIIRSEGIRALHASRNGGSFSSIKSDDLPEDSEEDSEEHHRDVGLQVVSTLGNELQNVKKAAILNAEGLTATVAKLGNRFRKAREFLNSEMKTIDEENGFNQVLNIFVQDSEADIMWLLQEEKKIMALVKRTGDYFHGKTGKDEGLRIFIVVRDFLLILDKVCREVKNMPAKSFATPKKEELTAKPHQPIPDPPRPTPDPRQRLFPAIRERQMDISSSDDEF